MIETEKISPDKPNQKRMRPIIGINTAVIITTITLLLLNPIFSTVSHSSRGMLPIIYAYDYPVRRILTFYVSLSVALVSLIIYFLNIPPRTKLWVRLGLVVVNLGLILVLFFYPDFLIINPEGNPPTWFENYQWPFYFNLTILITLILSESIIILLKQNLRR